MIQKKGDDFDYDQYRLELQFLFWLNKDFWWSVYCIPLGFAFSLLTIVLQIFIIRFDAEGSLLAMGELSWQLGNAIWMTLDFLFLPPTKSLVMWTSMFQERDCRFIAHFSQALFSIAIICSVTGYLLSKLYDKPFLKVDGNNYLILLFWSAKELMWNLSTFEDQIEHVSAYLGMGFGSVAMLIKFADSAASKSRRALFLNVVEMFWLAGNMSWMSAELFQNNHIGAIISVIFFSIGIVCAFGIVLKTFLRSNLIKDTL